MYLQVGDRDLEPSLHRLSLLRRSAPDCKRSEGDNVREASAVSHSLQHLLSFNTESGSCENCQQRIVCSRVNYYARVSAHFLIQTPGTLHIAIQARCLK